MVYFYNNGTYVECPYFNDPHSRAYMYSLASVFYLWDRPHYRALCFREDLVSNLNNVAVPGTFINLSKFFYCRFTAYVLIWLLAPCYVFWVVIWDKRSLSCKVELFENLLCRPTDWFNMWQLNCRVTSLHSYLTQSRGYSMENKWNFLQEAHRLGIPVSPFIAAPARFVLKNKNIEGGMGIHFFQNASAGGDWIIQEALYNDRYIASMLPDNAPLSTIRIITYSEHALLIIAKAEESNTEHESEVSRSSIKGIACVFRAGRAGVLTDHKSVLFNVDITSGIIGEGCTNENWYMVGVDGFCARWFKKQSEQGIKKFTRHPDSGETITGKCIPNITKLVQLCTDAHRACCPDVPLCGWDVALTSTCGPVLLEVNLSCNFFEAKFDLPEYFNFVDKIFRLLDGKLQANLFKKEPVL